MSIIRFLLHICQAKRVTKITQQPAYVRTILLTVNGHTSILEVSNG